MRKLSCNQPVRRQRYIPYCNNQPLDQDSPADDAADNEVQRKHGNPDAHRAAARRNPKPHPMEAEGQPAEYPEPQIVNRSILRTSGFEDANQQGRSGHRYYALSEKLKDNFFCDP